MTTTHADASPGHDHQQLGRHEHDAGHQHGGGHEHDHGQGPGTSTAGESYPHVKGGPTVLDIGGDIGAMIVTMNPDAAGTELHVRSADEPQVRIHTGVWRRGGGESSTTTAVFAELVEGRYWVLDSAGRDLRKVEIRGGELTSIDLPSAVANSCAAAAS